MKRISILLSIFILFSILTSCSDKAVKYYNRGLQYASNNDMEAAIASWEKSVAVRPDADAYYNIASAYLTLEEFAKSEQNMRRSIRMNGGDHTAHYKLGLALQKQGKLSQAKKSYKFAIQLKQNYLPPYIGIAQCALRQNNTNTLEKYSSAALMLSPDNIDANILYAESLYRNGDYTDAYMQLLPLRNTTNEKLLLLLGKVMYERRMYLDAYSTLYDARELGEAGSEVFLYLGLSSLRLDRLVEAGNYFKMAVYKDENCCRALAGLGETYNRRDNNVEAVESYKEAEKCDPKDPYIKGDYGVTLKNMKEYGEAVVKLEYAVKNLEDPGRFLYHLGQAYIGAGKKEKARDALKRFIETWRGDEKYIERANEMLKAL